MSASPSKPTHRLAAVIAKDDSTEHQATGRIPSKVAEYHVLADLDELPEELRPRRFVLLASACDRSVDWARKIADPADHCHLWAGQLPQACRVAGSVRAVNALFAHTRINGHKWWMTPRPQPRSSTEIESDTLEAGAALGSFMAAVREEMNAGALSESGSRRLESLATEVIDCMLSVRAGVAFCAAEEDGS